MIRLFVFFLILFSSFTSASCFTKKEYNELILKSLPDSNDDYYDKYPYGIIQNMANCNIHSELSNLVCNDLKLKKSLLLLSIGEIYAYENATHTPVKDYSTYNNDFRDWLNNLIKEEKNKDVALRKLCYIIKTRLSDDFGGDFHYNPKIHEVISSKMNQNGIIVNTLDTVIYLGNSCDAIIGTSKEKGVWYNDGDQFVVALSNKDGEFKEKYRFNHDDKVAKLNCMRPQ
ncbi:hypothetical protein [Rodentibacter caecimuris]|uniref:Uncharacterized protein n=1 Tax=Rodentibacter caecimuris TaxID=1796644 RepID=A0AAJ3K3R4_9PAST|nr:hypothetical protein [Rodentibacter heylii]AOF53068.1 hypothetical protein AC062_0974 [Pasteurellaceae bacterium NI1060]OOF71322.1 hypothetical protein BKG90_08560 [Rodentibacter heylii]